MDDITNIFASARCGHSNPHFELGEGKGGGGGLVVVVTGRKALVRLDDIARRGQLPCVIRAGGRDKADVSRFSRSACLDYEIFLFEGALPRILYSARPGPAGYGYFTSGRLVLGEERSRESRSDGIGISSR